jgi:hypothetical protein
MSVGAAFSGLKCPLESHFKVLSFLNLFALFHYNFFAISFSLLAESNISLELKREFPASFSSNGINYHFIIDTVFKVFPDLIYQPHFHVKETRNKVNRCKTLVMNGA